MMHNVLQDLRYGIRILSKSPGFALAAVLTLALGIGAVTSIFSVVDAVLLRPLPYKEPGQLVKVTTTNALTGSHAPGGGEIATGRDYFEWRDRNRVFSHIAAYSGNAFNLTGGGEAERVSCGQVTSAFFSLLSVRPVLGRDFTTEDDQASAPKTAILSYGFWQRRFGGDPKILDQTIVLNQNPHTVIGVLPPGFEFTDPYEIWVPMALDEAQERYGDTIRLLNVIARLKPGVRAERAREDLALITQRFGRGMDGLMEPPPSGPVPPPPSGKAMPSGDFMQPLPSEIGEASPALAMADIPVNPPPGARMVQKPFPAGGPPSGGALVRKGPAGAKSRPSPAFSTQVNLVGLHEYVVGNIRPAMRIIMVSVGLVLLIACANVANLLLARAAGRQQEMAVRAALGASRSRIVRQLLTECVLLGLLGGISGLLLALWGLDVLRSLSVVSLPHIQKIEINYSVLAFTLLVSVLTGFVFGLAPSLHVTRPALHEALKESGHGLGGGRDKRRLRSALVVSEIALAMMLLIASGLLLKSFYLIRQVDPGFRAENLLTMTLHLPNALYAEDHQKTAFYRQALAQAAQAPGVLSVGAADHLPLTDYSMMVLVQVEGYERPPEKQPDAVSFCTVSPDYFRTLGIALRLGRGFEESDHADAPPVVLVNQAFVDQYVPDQRPLGKWVTGPFDPGGPGGRATVIGVVENVLQEGLGSRSQPEVYVSYLQRPSGRMMLAARTSPAPLSVAPLLRDLIRRLDPNLPVHSVLTMEQRLSDSITPQRLNTILLGAFAFLAWLLATVGIYGVLAYLVTQQTHEFGVRMALGANARDVFRLVLSRGMKLCLVGIVLGLLGSLAATRILAGMLFGIGAQDLSTFVGVSILFILVAAAACTLPARRAASVDPIAALRCE